MEEEKGTKQTEASMILVHPSEAVISYSERDLDASNCHFCQGIIHKYYTRSGTQNHCSKVCLEMCKMLKNSGTPVTSDNIHTKQLAYYKEVLRERSASPSAFSLVQTTENVVGLESGMKLEAIDINNPVNFCVGTVIQVLGHRLKIRYDGFGDDPTHDFWCNFQAEELYPITWCANHGFVLQPPTGITCTQKVWKAFLADCLTGALIAPDSLFKKTRRVLRCHSYRLGHKVEVIHPNHPHLIVPATVTKSLGPHYFMVTTDLLPGLPHHTFYGFAECPGIYPKGWCASKYLELFVPPQGSDRKMCMVCVADSLVEKSTNPSSLSVGKKRLRLSNFKPGVKVESAHNDQVCVTTVAYVFGGRVILLTVDGSNEIQFVDKLSVDIHPIGWSESCEGMLNTPYGPISFLKPNLRQSYASTASFVSYQDILEQQTKYMTIAIRTSVTTTPKNTPTCAGGSTFVIASPVSTMSGDTLKPSSIQLPIEPSKIVISTARIASPHNLKAKFVVWVLNNFEYSPAATDSFSSGTLSMVFTQATNFAFNTSLVKLIPSLITGVTIDQRVAENIPPVTVVNCMKKTSFEPMSGPIYVKDAVSFLNSRSFHVMIGQEKIVTYMGIGDSFVFPDKRDTIYSESKAPPNSNVLVISKQISGYTLCNFMFYFGDKICAAPLKSIKSADDFRAMIMLCNLATICPGVASNFESIPSKNFVKSESTENWFSKNCALLVYPHESRKVCTHCLLFENEIPLVSDVDDGLLSKLDELSTPKDDEDSLPSPDIQIYLNLSCNYGMYFDPSKLATMESNKTPLERPAEVLKCLVESLISVAISKDKLLELIEGGFGGRIFNRAKDKVVKKGLFRFNTPKKVVRFLARLTKRLGSCENFLSIEQKPCMLGCKSSLQKQLMKKKKKPSLGIEVTSPLNVPTESDSKPSITTTKTPLMKPLSYPGPVLSPSTPHLVVQSPSGQNLNLNHFPQGTKFIIPQTVSGTNPVRYMVLSKESVVYTPTLSMTNSPLSTPTCSHNFFTSPPMGVSKMIENISRTSLMSDIDEPHDEPLSPYHDPVLSFTDQQGNQDSLRNAMQTGEKHVHKTHHGNARVKYVEYKPKAETYQDPVYFPRFHSPPALRPPPSMNSRMLPMSSPPSLIASPKLCPRFEFNTGNAYHQQGFMGSPKPLDHQLASPGHFLPRVNQSHFRPIKFHHVEASQVANNSVAVGNKTQNKHHDNKSALTYIPIHATSKEKFVYLPVNSVNQSVVLYQPNQTNSGEQGKQVLVPVQQQQQNVAKETVVFTSVGHDNVQSVSNLPAVVQPTSSVNHVKEEEYLLTPSKKSPHGKMKRKRGRPPSSFKAREDDANSNLTFNDPTNLAKQLLTGQENRERNGFINLPLSKLPRLPSNPELWTVDDVRNFLLETDCSAHAQTLWKEEIDGRSFLLLTHEALTEFMGVRLGPALKISSYSAQLRARWRAHQIKDGSPSPQSKRIKLEETQPTFCKTLVDDALTTPVITTSNSSVAVMSNVNNVVRNTTSELDTALGLMTSVNNVAKPHVSPNNNESIENILDNHLVAYDTTSNYNTAVNSNTPNYNAGDYITLNINSTVDDMTSNINSVVDDMTSKIISTVDDMTSNINSTVDDMTSNYNAAVNPITSNNTFALNNVVNVPLDNLVTNRDDIVTSNSNIASPKQTSNEIQDENVVMETKQELFDLDKPNCSQVDLVKRDCSTEEILTNCFLQE